MGGSSGSFLIPMKNFKTLSYRPIVKQKGRLFFYQRQQWARYISLHNHAGHSYVLYTQGFQSWVIFTPVNTAINISIYGLDGAISTLDKSTNYSWDGSSLFNWNRVITSKRLLGQFEVLGSFFAYNWRKLKKKCSSIHIRDW